MVFDFIKKTEQIEQTKDIQSYIDEVEESNCINWELLNLKVDREIKEDVEKMLKEEKGGKNDGTKT